MVREEYILGKAMATLSNWGLLHERIRGERAENEFSKVYESTLGACEGSLALISYRDWINVSNEKNIHEEGKWAQNKDQFSGKNY